MAKTRLREWQGKPDWVWTQQQARARRLNEVVDGMSALPLISFNSGTRVATLTYGLGLQESLIFVGCQVAFSALPGAAYTVEAVLSETTFRTVETPPSSPSTGTLTFYYPPGATRVGVNQTPLTGLLSGQTTVQGCLEVLDSFHMSWYDASGVLIRPKVFVGRFNAPAAANTLSIAAAGFTSILLVQATPERNTSTVADVPLASIRSYTTASVVVQLVESSGILIGGQGLEYSVHPTTYVHLMVVGL